MLLGVSSGRGVIAGEHQIRTHVDDEAVLPKDLSHGMCAIDVEGVGPGRAFFAYIEIADACTVNDMRGLEFPFDPGQPGPVSDAKRSFSWLAVFLQTAQRLLPPFLAGPGYVGSAAAAADCGCRTYQGNGRIDSAEAGRKHSLAE